MLFMSGFTLLRMRVFLTGTLKLSSPDNHGWHRRTLDLRRPTPLVLRAPTIFIASRRLDPPVLRVEMQFPVDFPAMLESCSIVTANVATEIGALSFSFADSRDKVREVSNRSWKSRPEEVSERGVLPA